MALFTYKKTEKIKQDSFTTILLEEKLYAQTYFCAVK